MTAGKAKETATTLTAGLLTFVVVGHCEKFWKNFVAIHNKIMPFSDFSSLREILEKFRGNP
jgi:hypothetical protein